MRGKKILFECNLKKLSKTFVHQIYCKVLSGRHSTRTDLLLKALPYSSPTFLPVPMVTCKATQKSYACNCMVFFKNAIFKNHSFQVTDVL